MARGLAKLGIKKGDRVAMIQASNPRFVTAFFGIMKAGGIAVPLDSRYVADELASLFEDCRPAALFIEEAPLESTPAGHAPLQVTKAYHHLRRDRPR